jgi:hypothetical protein
VQRRRARWVWGGRIAAVVVITGLAIFLSVAGLNKADKLGSALGLLVAAAALVAPYLLPASDRSSSVPRSTQSVANTIVGGHLTQARGGQSFRVQGSGAASAPPTAPTGDGTTSAMPSGQYVNGVWVGGNLTQIDGADGDVTLG